MELARVNMSASEPLSSRAGAVAISETCGASTEILASGSSAYPMLRARHGGSGTSMRLSTILVENRLDHRLQFAAGPRPEWKVSTLIHR